MNDNPKPLIVFDLGAVLIDWNPRYLYRELLDGDEQAIEYFLNEVCSPAWNIQQDAGRPFAEAIDGLIQQFPEHRELITAYFERWEDMLGGPIEDSVAILQQIKALGFPVAALSNWSAETFPVARRRYSFLNWFDELVISGHERVAKPDPGIYRILLARTGRAAEDCIFIDDSPVNVEAARDLGFTAIHFRSAGQLRQELHSMHQDLKLLFE